MKPQPDFNKGWVRSESVNRYGGVRRGRWGLELLKWMRGKQAKLGVNFNRNRNAHWVFIALGFFVFPYYLPIPNDKVFEC